MSGTTWNKRTSLSNSVSPVKLAFRSAGSLAKAWLSGASTVNGPGPERVSASPANFTRDTRVVAPTKYLSYSNGSNGSVC